MSKKVGKDSLENMEKIKNRISNVWKTLVFVEL